MIASTAVKVLLALFLGAFLWFVLVSIQAPRQQVGTPATQDLRQELLNRMEDVTLEFGDLSIRAAVQETYRNGETHFLDFTAVSTGEKRTIEIIGKVAQTKYEGTNLSFAELHGNIRVKSTDGLDLQTETLNYENSQKRIFSLSPVVYTLNNISGTGDSFIYYTESNLLELRGKVRARFIVQDTDDAAGQSSEKHPVNVYCFYLAYDQDKHTLVLEDRVRVAQTGSFVKADRIDADLTDDNQQFISMLATNSKSKGEEEEGEEKAVAEDSDNAPATLSHHASGIKNLSADTLLMEYTTGEKNVLELVTADGNAKLDIAPTAEQKSAGAGSYRKISADLIEAVIGPDGKGLSSLRASSRKDKAIFETRPLKDRSRNKKGKEKGKPLPRITKAKEITVDIDAESGDFKTVFLVGGVELIQGDLLVTGSTGKLDVQKDKLSVEGKPVLKDKVKRVSGDSMVVSLDISDLSADGNVQSIFYPQEDADSENPGIFVIGGEIDQTIVTAGSLRFDYENDVLRYAGGVRVLQGSTTIQSQNLDIYQKEARLIAYGRVTADIKFAEKDESEENGAGENDNGPNAAGSETTGDLQDSTSTKKDTSKLLLTGERLEINKEKGEIRISKNVRALQEGLTIYCQDLRYKINQDNVLVKAIAKSGVRITVDQQVIAGEITTAELFVAEQLLVVNGKNILLQEAGKLVAYHQKLTLDLSDGTLRFDARADQLLRTRISADQK